MKKRQVIILGGGPAGSTTAVASVASGHSATDRRRERPFRGITSANRSVANAAALSGTRARREDAGGKLSDKHGVNVFNPNGVPFWVEVKRRCPETAMRYPDLHLVGNAQRLMITFSSMRPAQRGAEYIGVRSSFATLARKWPCDRPADSDRRRRGWKTFSAKSSLIARVKEPFLPTAGLTGPKVKGGYANQSAVYSQLAWSDSRLRDSSLQRSMAILLSSIRRRIIGRG